MESSSTVGANGQAVEIWNIENSRNEAMGRTRHWPIVNLSCRRPHEREEYEMQDSHLLVLLPFPSMSCLIVTCAGIAKSHL